MSKTEMIVGFAMGITLCQEEWAEQPEIDAVDECIAEGLCTLTEPWHYSENHQCEIRRMKGVVLK